MFAQYLVIDNNLNWPQKHTEFSKVGSKVSRILNKPSKNSEIFLHFAKVVKFRQIWSHRVHNLGKQHLGLHHRAFQLREVTRPRKDKNLLCLRRFVG